MSSWEKSLALVGALVTAMAVALSVAPPEPAVEAAMPAAIVLATVGDVKRRPAEKLGWQRLAKSMGVFDADAVFVPPAGEGVLRFDDGTELFIDERSLVVVERAPKGRRLKLRQGALSGRAGHRSLEVDTPVGVATLEPASEARIVLAPSAAEVTVRRGRASVGPAKVVEPGQRVLVGSRGPELLPPWPVDLVSPEAEARRGFVGAPAPVTLSWAGVAPSGARLQVAHDRLFTFVALDVPARGKSYTIERPDGGVTWWRLVDERGAPVSEARRLVLVERLPPVPMTPVEGEVVLAPEGELVAFAWTMVPGVERYRVEFAASERFEPVAMASEVSTSAAHLALGLGEDIWYWRVLPLDDDAAPASKASRFRLIHRPIPQTPELLKPEIEFGD